MNLCENTQLHQEANETYYFQFSEEEMKEIQSSQRSSVYKKPVRFTMFSVLLFLLFIFTGAPDIFVGFALGMLYIGTVSNVKGILLYKKAWKSSYAKARESAYKYEIFDDYFTIEIFRSGEKVRLSKMYFDEIEKVQPLKNHYLLQIHGQLFIVRRSDLKENSMLYSYLYKNPSKIMGSEIPRNWKMVSGLLFVLSLSSIFIALFLVSVVSRKNGLFIENMWLFFAVIPIPIASIVYGVLAKKKGYKYKKNLTVGIIMTALLCVYGSFVFVF